jgi:rhodanese-related sulfurtransferase
MSLAEVIKSGNYELIDVREPMELEMDGNIDGAKNIPLGEVEDRQDEILSIEKPVILFCRSGNRSGKALEYLKSQGLKDGYNGGGWAELKATIEANQELFKVPFLYKNFSMNLKERFSESCLQFTQDQNLIENCGLRLKKNI